MTNRVRAVKDRSVRRDDGDRRDDAHDDDLIRRAVAERDAGATGAAEVQALIETAAQRNQAALDRLAR